MSFILIPTPPVNKDASIVHKAEPIEVNESKAKKALKDCLELTKESAKLTFSPEYSAFIQGIKLASSERSGGYLSGLEQGMGILFLMASPVWAAIRLSLGIPMTVIGTIGTASTAVAYGVEKGINQIQKLQKPSEANIQREHLTQLFVDRMKMILKNLSYDQQYRLQQDPTPLIYIGILSIAFLSSNLDDNQIKVGEDALTLNHIQNQDKIRKKQFELICEAVIPQQKIYFFLNRMIIKSSPYGD